MMPPSASISRTRCPFAVPPIAGLHGMCATVSFVSVHNPTWTPIRAAAYAASHPACPAPITMTSNSRLLMSLLLADAESGEDVGEQIVGRAPAVDFFERRAGISKIREHELLRQGRIGGDGGARACERAVRAVDERDMPYVRDRRAVARQVDVERGGDRAAQHVEPGTGRRRHRNRPRVGPRRRQIRFVRNINHFAMRCALLVSAGRTLIARLIVD